MKVVTEPDPTPLVMIIAGTVRRSLDAPGTKGRIRGVRGTFALRSLNDPQAVSVTLEDSRVYVQRGSTGADVVITADLDLMAEPDPPKPKVSGAARHPRLALAAAKLLEPPLGSWRSEAERFMEFALRSPDMPRPVRVVCTDDGSEMTFGAVADEPPVLELHGSGHRLVNAMSGSTLITQDVLDGKLRVCGSLRDLSLMTGRALAWMFGGIEDD